MATQISPPPELDEARRCIRCGLCLTVCPTFQLLQTESDSPRGRLSLMRAVAEGNLDRTAGYQLHLDRCLGCRACEAICPAGVEYGHLLEIARADLAQTRPAGGFTALLRTITLRWLLPSPRRLSMLAGLLRIMERTGLLQIARSPLGRRILPGLARAAGQLPPLPSRSFSASSIGSHGSGLTKAPPAPERRSAYLFVGCVMPHLYPGVHEATRVALARAGISTRIASGERCCGAVHAHTGDLEMARRLAKQNLEAFEGDELIVLNSAGCGAMLKEYGRLLQDEPEWAEQARRFARRIRDVSEVLAPELENVPTARSVPPSSGSSVHSGERPRLRVAYQHPCHLAHAQRIRHEPLMLLRSLPGIEVVDFDGSDVCCGSAGVYNLLQPDLSRRLSEQKIQHILASGADVVATANPGCLNQLRLGVAAGGYKLRVCHVVELVAESGAGWLTRDARPE